MKFEDYLSEANLNSVLKDFEKTAKEFDTSYDMSDDMRLWREGNAQKSKLKKLFKEILYSGDKSAIDKLESIMDKYKSRLSTGMGTPVFYGKNEKLKDYIDNVVLKYDASELKGNEAFRKYYEDEFKKELKI